MSEKRKDQLVLLFLIFAIFATFCGRPQAFAQSSSATPKSLDQKTKEIDDWIRQNLPNQATPKPTAADDLARETRFREINDARQQLDVDMSLKHQNDPKWAYTQISDPMGRGVTKMAELKSANSVEFRFPYGGLQHGTLILQKGPSLDRKRVPLKRVFLLLEHGQFLFESSGLTSLILGQTLSVRFDTGELQRTPGIQLSDGRTNEIEILSADEFIAQLRKAKKLAVEATFFQEGTRVFEFDVHGLDGKNW